MPKDQDVYFEEAVFGNKQASIDYVELPMQRQIFWGLGILTVAIGIFAVGRILYLGVTRGDFYTNRATANMQKQIAIPSERGGIVDRFGKPLVQNESIFSVFLDVREFLKKSVDDRALLIDEVQKILGSSSEENNLMDALQGADLEQYSIIALQRGVDTVTAIAIRGMQSPAIIVHDDYRRVYLQGAELAHVIGYTGLGDVDRSIVGKSGLEQYYDRQLRGKDGMTIETRDARGNILDSRVDVESKPGAGLKTTIDVELQEFFYKRMQDGLHALGRDAGLGIILKPKTGEILALVNLPSFDNNAFTRSGKSEERVRALQSPLKPLFNRAVSGLYSPGSTIKPMMALAALHEGIVQPTDQFFSSGSLELPNPYDPEHPSHFLDWKAHGWVDLHSALARSSNVYFYIIGGGWKDLVGLGIARIKTYWDRFGFGTKTGIDIPNEGQGVLYNQAEWEKKFHRTWRVGNTYNTSIGQGDLLVTPLRLIAFIGAIGEGGAMQQPHLMSAILDQKNNAIEESIPKEILNFTDLGKEIKEVQEGMKDTVRMPYGTAHLLADLPTSIAAKTGSAQILNNAKVNAFFVGYAPADNPEIAILVLIEDAKEGSLNTIPIAKDAFQWYYKYRTATAHSDN